MEECNPGATGALIWVPYRNVTQPVRPHEINENMTYQHFFTGTTQSQMFKEMFYPGRWDPTM